MKAWTDNYWEIVNAFYWVPSYVGLKSIPQRHWTITDNTVSIPREMTNPSGPLYYRSRSGDEYWDFIRRQEETFNHILNLALSILPGDVISEIFRDIAELEDPQDYELFSQPVGEKYPWVGSANVAAPDVFLLSDRSVLAIEIKFNAKTNLDQLAKYVALMASEEIYVKSRPHYHLLYLYPSDAEDRFEAETSIKPNKIGVEDAGVLEEHSRNEQVKQFFHSKPDAINLVLERLTLRCVTWQQFAEALTKYSGALTDTPGDRALRRLLDGLMSELRAHPFSEV